MPNLESRVFRRLIAVAMISFGGAAMAHEPVARCVQLDAATVRCRGATNDGDEMPGARMDVIAIDGETLLEGHLDDQSILTFSTPTRPYYVLFDIGAGLQVTVEQDEILPAPVSRPPRWMRGR